MHINSDYKGFPPAVCSSYRSLPVRFHSREFCFPFGLHGFTVQQHHDSIVSRHHDVVHSVTVDIRHQGRDHHALRHAPTHKIKSHPILEAAWSTNYPLHLYLKILNVIYSVKNYYLVKKTPQKNILPLKIKHT